VRVENALTRAKALGKDPLRFAETMRVLDEVLSFDPGHVEALALRETVKTRHRALVEQALSKIRGGIQQNRLLDAARAMRELHRLDPAHRVLVALLEDTRLARRRLARQLYYRGLEAYGKDRLQEAIERWEEVLLLDPDNEQAILNIEKARRKVRQR